MGGLIFLVFDAKLVPRAILSCRGIATRFTLEPYGDASLGLSLGVRSSVMRPSFGLRSGVDRPLRRWPASTSEAVAIIGSSCRRPRDLYSLGLLRSFDELANSHCVIVKHERAL